MDIIAHDFYIYDECDIDFSLCWVKNDDFKFGCKSIVNDVCVICFENLGEKLFGDGV